MIFKPQVVGYLTGYVGSKFSLREPMGKTLTQTSEMLKTMLQNLSVNQIYNADDTGLFYRATPVGSLCYKHKRLSGSKISMDHVTMPCYMRICLVVINANYT